jgi:hypothetical protein
MSQLVERDMCGWPQLLRPEERYFRLLEVPIASCALELRELVRNGRGSHGECVVARLVRESRQLVVRVLLQQVSRTEQMLLGREHDLADHLLTLCSGEQLRVAEWRWFQGDPHVGACGAAAAI